jgi:hypothetical protein
MNWIAALATCAIFIASSAFAATITIGRPDNESGMMIVAVGGDLEVSDGPQFKSKTSALSQAVVLLQSDGGSVLAGIEIGEAIRLKGFQTLVIGRCASACALAWLGGTQRFMKAGAQIGFHAAYDSDSRRESGVANAIVGAYLNRIGLPYSAVIYITMATPTSMTWLDVSQAKRIGIDVALLSAPNLAPAPKSIDTAQVGRRRTQLYGRKADSLWKAECDPSRSPGYARGDQLVYDPRLEIIGTDQRVRRGVPENSTILAKTAPKATGGNTWDERSIVMKVGETLSAILRDLGATPEEIKAITAVLGPRGRDGYLEEGQKLRVLLSPVKGSQRLQPLRLMLVGESGVEAVVALSDLGRYVSVDMENFAVTDMSNIWCGDPWP